MRGTVFCLHGFLGRPSDWDFLKPPSNDIRIEKVDPFRILAPSPSTGISDWAGAFNKMAAAHPDQRVLMGYSMGGRLALHALIRNPSLWDAAIIVSASPGIPESERQARIVADETWARRFESESWGSVVQAWDTLPVFGGRPQSLPRAEAEYRRSDLAGALRAWSVGRQEDLKARLTTFEFPILWVTGEQDIRYCDAARDIQARIAPGSPGSGPHFWEFVKIPDAGHRAPWDQPELFQEHFSGFLTRVFG
jgi:2-succinyl-6-hydroxy-2,4-cyclohexadiene-1-carboxylate synthase